MGKRVTLRKIPRSPADEAALRDWFRELIERDQKLYDADSNPTHAWHAYELARMVDLPIPDWVFEYLDFAANNVALMSSTRRPPIKAGQIAPRVVAAFGFVRGGVELEFIRHVWPNSPEASRDPRGAYNPIARERSRAGVALSEAVWASEQAGKTRTDAVRETAATHHVSTRTVYRALDKYPGPARDTK